MDVPVSVETIRGQRVDQTIKVTIFRDDRKITAPYLVLNHGRPASPADFPGMKRQRFANNAKYLASLGFVVFVPTRVGYGESGGPDVEYSGQCERKNYAPVYAAAADQTIAVINAAANLPYVDTSRGIVIGQSFGGTTAIALSARGIPGLVGAVNFAGGGGGNPATKPENPCGQPLLSRLFNEYGRASRAPTLWLYSENDRYWGATLPRQWFDGFVQTGGRGKFIQLPSYKDNGHAIFTGDPDAWKPAFESFLGDIGLR